MTRTKILLVCCGLKKAVCSLCAARHLYVGNLFRARAAYADATKSPWWILSAKHGLVEQRQMLAPYDLHIERLKLLERAAWGRNVVEHLVLELAHGVQGRMLAPEECELEIHAGGLYVGSLLVPAEAAGFTLKAPISGLGIGQQLRWYMDHTPTHLRAPTAAEQRLC